MALPGRPRGGYHPPVPLPRAPYPVLLLAACTLPVNGTVSGDVPPGATVVLLWPEDGAMGRVAGTAEVQRNGRFELRAGQPGDQHPGLAFGTLALVDGEPARGSTLDLDDIDVILGAAPAHYVVDSNATCGVQGGCTTRGGFDRGMACGACDDDGACRPVGCRKVEVVATDAPLALDWKIPEVRPVSAVFAADDAHVAYIDGDTIAMFPTGGVGGPIFRVDARIDAITGLSADRSRVAARVTDGVGQTAGYVRDFDGRNLLELKVPGLHIADGPVLSPDATLAAAVWADGTLSVYALDDGAEVATLALPGDGFNAHWSPTSQVVYAVPSDGGPALALAVVPGAVPGDFPECTDGAPSPAADRCAPDGLAVVADSPLGHPVLLRRPCDAAPFEDLPRWPDAVPTRACFGGVNP